MAAKYEERKQYVAEEKPYWLNLRHPRRGEMRYELNNYFPDAHYRKAVEEAGYSLDGEEPEVRTDGGTRTQYYWSGDQGVLYHTEQGEDMVVPFFDTVEDAERFLEQQADRYGNDRYSGMVLRKTGNQKVEEATDVLTDQSGLADFAADGGPGYDGEDDKDVVPDGGVDLRELAYTKVERALHDPIVAHPPTSDYAPPEGQPVYDAVIDARLEQVGETGVEEPVTEASWPETLLYLHTASFDGAVDSPGLDRAHREASRRYVDEFSDYDPDELDEPVFEDPDLGDDEWQRLDELRAAIKRDRDRFFMSKAGDEFGWENSVYPVDPDPSIHESQDAVETLSEEYVDVDL
ncbi:MAG: hypothetical protein SVU32_05280 [Candidatus Nanohaloarchaea archaeon]|nr:hypothetical protein [Candidatus Nanohaloarchaea archaeon]